ncbi:MAG: hypothetical protein GYA17_18045, partial [Chloroflexi bacterium]|nr:hypothetical protein [Chloroflexota bacterium]
LSGGIPARVLSVEVEGQDEIPSRGSVSLPDQRASGTVLLRNLTDQEIELPGDTVVRTSTQTPVRFRFTDSVHIPAGQDQEVAAAIAAVDPGASGNVPAGAIQAIEGAYGLRVTVTNPQETSGGSDRSSPAPDAQDYRQLRSRLLESLEQTALDDLSRQLDAGQQIVQGTLQMVSVVSETRQPGPGEPGDRLNLTLRVEYSAWVIRNEDVRQLVTTAMDAGLPQGFRGINESLFFTALDEADLVSGAAHWNIRAARMIQTDWKAEQIIRAVLGQAPLAAAQALQSQLSLDGAPEIVVWPAWWPRLPFLPFRIEVMAQ